MIDIVYILGTGSKWNDNELRYSLRSVQAHVSGYRNIYIVGACPEWLNTAAVIHIPADDEKPGNLVYKERNIMLKLLQACAIPQLSLNFLFMNDDHFFLQPVAADAIPNYYHNNLPTAIADRGIKDQYCASMTNTRNLLAKNKLYDLFFDVHTPIIYNKRKFADIMSACDWNLPFGYVIKSVYGNCLELPGTHLDFDVKLNGMQSCTGMQEQIAHWPFFSTGNTMNWDELETLMDFLYPNPSPYEK